MSFQYTNPLFDRDYQFNAGSLTHRMIQGDRELASLIGHLRLVNTRNRLTHALLKAIVHGQHDYLVSGDRLQLRSMSQAELVARLRRSTDCPVSTDPSRVSRLLRRLTVCLLGGEIVPLSSLCPKPRALHITYVSEVIKEERTKMLADHALVPMNDPAIARAVRGRFGVRLLPRTVAYIRRDLGIPASKDPARRACYLAVTLEFSPVLPLNADTLRLEVPAGPGVYEIRLTPANSRSGAVLYLGSARNLRKRLQEHARGYSNNPLLQKHIQEGVCLRYRVVPEDCRRAAEREAYQAFCASFDAPPPCNRMSP